MIKTIDLSKKYNDTYVVDKVNLNVKSNEIFGFIGTNGAGKTTTIKMLSTIITPTSGAAQVGGFDIKKDSLQVRKNISVIPQGSSLNLFLNTFENIRIYLLLKGYSFKQATQLTKEAIEKYDLEAHSKKKSFQLSGGLRKRVQLARTLICDSELVFLDEPTTGLDPHSKHITWNYIREAKKSGKTIFLTTQAMEEAEELCDRICFLHKGKIVSEGTMAELKKENEIGKVKIKIDEGDWSAIKQGSLNHKIGDFSFAEGEIEMYGISKGIELLNELHKNNIKVLSYSTYEPSLEEIYFKVMGEKTC